MDSNDIDDKISRLKLEIDSDEPLNLSQVLETLECITNLSRNREIRDSLKKNDIDTLVRGQEPLLQCITQDKVHANKVPCLNCMTELYRSLRNACAGCETNQDYVSQNQDCFRQVSRVISMVTGLKLADGENHVTVLLRCLVQFLGNCVTKHTGNQNHVFSHLSCSLSLLLDYGDEKLTNFTCMVVHNCMIGADKEGSTSHWSRDEGIRDMLVTVVKNTTLTECEFGMFVVEDILQRPTLMVDIQQSLSTDEQLMVMEVLLHMLGTIPHPHDDSHRTPSLHFLQHLATVVKQSAKDILFLPEAKDTDKDPYLIVKYIEALGIAVSLPDIYGPLKDDVDLLTCSVYLLHAVQKLGKQGDNTFTNIDKITQRDRVDPSHPVYGLKRDLIRLIGNMVHEHRPNQDKVREMDGIALILDQTSIDGRNPFITQWAIFAIRNLCQDNTENKAVLASLKMQGLDRNVSALDEMGIEAEVRGDKVYVKPSGN